MNNLLLVGVFIFIAGILLGLALSENGDDEEAEEEQTQEDADAEYNQRIIERAYYRGIALTLSMEPTSPPSPWIPIRDRCFAIKSGGAVMEAKYPDGSIRQFQNPDNLPRGVSIRLRHHKNEEVTILASIRYVAC